MAFYVSAIEFIDEGSFLSLYFVIPHTIKLILFFIRWIKDLVERHRTERVLCTHAETKNCVLIGKWPFMQTQFTQNSSNELIIKHWKLSGSSYDSFARITSIFIWRNALRESECPLSASVNEKVATIKLDYISDSDFGWTQNETPHLTPIQCKAPTVEKTKSR